MENSKIEWTHHTFNPWVGCTKVSDGCKNCYAENLMDKRMGRVQWGPAGTRDKTSEAYWKKPLAWNRKLEGTGRRERVFCASLADVFEDREELVDWRNELFQLMELTQNLDWLLLTKRPENVMNMIRHDWATYLPSNIWIGTSVENQEQADKRIPELLKIPAKVRFLSCEPLLGPVDLMGYFPRYDYRPTWEFQRIYHGWDSDKPIKLQSGIDWLICGGESGPNARPMHPEWARSLRDQCQEAEVPFLFKQWGEWLVSSEMRQGVHPDPGIYSWPWRDSDDDFTMMVRVGKKAAGRLLDGREWNEFPEVELV